MKGNRGITLIILIVTVVIMLILGSVGIYVGMESVEHSRVVKFVSYMQIIQKKVDELVFNNNYGELGISASGQSNVQEILSLASANGEINSTEAEASKYKYFNKSTLSSQLGIDNIEDEIIINFTTREVVSLNGIEYNSKMYYTQYLLPNGQNIIIKSADEKRNMNFNIYKDIDGLQATIKINNISITNGTLSYKEGNEAWNIITNYTKQNKSEEIIISKSAIYTFRLTDNTDNTNYYEETINLVLTNPPILNDDMTYVKEEYDYSGGINSTYGAVATDGTKEYVWVPRFAYKEGTNNIKFLKGTTRITTSGEKLDNDFIINSAFSNNEGIGYLEKTGIWVENNEEELSKIVPVIQLTISSSSINKAIKAGETATVELTATLINATGDLTWTSSNTSVAQISGTGNTRTITLYKTGTEEETATITVSYGEYIATCKINIVGKFSPKVGDYVKYTPDSGSYQVTQAMSGYSGYSTPVTFITQTGEEALKWKIWSIDEETDEVVLVAATATTDVLYLSGADGYNHGVDILDEMCKTLYSNANKGAIARSIKSEDINTISNYTPSQTREGFGVSSYINTYYPKIYAIEDREWNGIGLQESEGVKKTDGTADYTKYTGYTNSTLQLEGERAKVSDYSYFAESIAVSTCDVPEGLISVGSAYWLASRCVDYQSGTYEFEIRVCRADRLYY